MENIKIDKVTYMINESGCYLLTCEKDATEVVIPTKVNGETVCGISANAFKNCSSLRKVVFEDADCIDYLLNGISYSIGDYAFRNCTSLRKIKLPDYVSSIGWGAFMDCENLKVVEMDESVYLEPYVFYRCKSLEKIKAEYCNEGTFSYCESLKDFPLTEKTKEIGDDCFEHCYSLEEIFIPKSVKRIGELAFRNCRGLKKITFEEPNGWKFKSMYFLNDKEIDFSDPERNARSLGSIDFDDGVKEFYKK